jgi:hypothetical protein
MPKTGIQWVPDMKERRRGALKKRATVLLLPEEPGYESRTCRVDVPGSDFE